MDSMKDLRKNLIAQQVRTLPRQHGHLFPDMDECRTESSHVLFSERLDEKLKVQVFGLEHFSSWIRDRTKVIEEYLHRTEWHINIILYWKIEFLNYEVSRCSRRVFRLTVALNSGAARRFWFCTLGADAQKADQKDQAPRALLHSETIDVQRAVWWWYSWRGHGGNGSATAWT